ncbi:hypothetical protein FGLOB1_1555 [Fusarium globosum]|uniref:Uncharacterized protein n=1 Tax=Fusarium globosum TaxID=78864 RepID=A0A8H6DI41_9HYPO|nr:hypothetical protein FGLOB1_1555 [Fusarium globosum]
MGPSTPGTAMLIGRRSVRKCSVRKSKFTKVYPNLLFIAHLNKSGSFWDGQQLLICHVIAAKKRGSVLPGFENKPFAATLGSTLRPTPKLRMSKYGTNLGGIWAALATVTAYKYKAATPTTINPPTPSNQSGSPSKRPRRGGPAPKYSDSDSDEPTLTRKDSQGSSCAEQVRSKDLPPEDSVVLLIMRALNLIAYCTQQFGSQQPTIPILTLTNRAQAVKVALLATSWNKWHTLNSKSQAARKRENLKLKDEEISVYEYISHPPKAELKHSNGPLCIDELHASQLANFIKQSYNHSVTRGAETDLAALAAPLNNLIDCSHSMAPITGETLTAATQKTSSPTTLIHFAFLECAPEMTQQTPITKSLHRLCVENPRFLVHPLFWTSEHLQVLHCHFKHLDSSSAPPPFPLPPASPPASHGGPDLAKDLIHSIWNGRYVETMFASFRLLMHPLGVVPFRPWTPFLYNKLKVHIPKCEVYRIDNVHKFEQQPIIGYFHYDILANQRKYCFVPKKHPVPGTSNLPVERLYQRRLRNLTPALWFEDPYLVCVLLSLAQMQWKKRESMTEAYFARLFVTKRFDTTHAHVFRADIPSKILHALDKPTEGMDNLVWPAIQHIQVPFEPHATFSERVAGQLLAGLKTQAQDEPPHV